MLGEFPQAIAMQHPNQPDEAILQCDAQCILQKHNRKHPVMMFLHSLISHRSCSCVFTCWSVNALSAPVRPNQSVVHIFSYFFDLFGSDLQIYAVTPVPDSVGVLQMDRVPDRIKSFYRVNNVRRFRYDRPFHKGPKDRDNEFKVSGKTFAPRQSWHQFVLI